MSNIFQDIGNFFRNVNNLSALMQDSIGTRNSILAAYYEGDHIPQLKVKSGQNDNVITNHIGVNVNRSVSRMFRGGVKFNLPKRAMAQQEYIDTVWALNKKEILLHKLGMNGAVMGTAYLKIEPDVLTNPITSELDYYPRLTVIYSDFVRITTDPKDADKVLLYRIEWSSVVDEETVTYRQDIERRGEVWQIIDSELRGNSNKWEITASIKWEYDFPPVIHCQNLPSLSSAYGMDEVSDAVNIQNRFNFVTSNTGKIIKHQAHRRPVITGVIASQIEFLDDSPDAAMVLSTPNATATMLESTSDLASSRAFAGDLQKGICAVMREVDMSAIQNLGDITNYELRVLYTDAIDKTNTKRALYGEMLKEVNRRLLVIKGFVGEKCDPGDIKWGDAIEVNISEEVGVDKQLKDMGLVDAATIYQRYAERYGKSWEDIKVLIDAEQAVKDARQKEIFGRQDSVNNGGENTA